MYFSCIDANNVPYNKHPFQNWAAWSIKQFNWYYKTEYLDKSITRKAWSNYETEY